VPPSLAVITVRRTISVGWLYFAIGIFFSLVLSVILIFVTKSPTAFSVAFPLEVPLFAVLGSIGALMTFTSDRTKGVFEYLIAYGIRPSALFAYGLIAAAVMSGVIVGVELGIGIGLASIHHVVLTSDFWMTLELYSIPMCFAGALFVAIVGMIWASVSSPRAGLNGPVGFAPMIGIGPVVVILLISETVPSTYYYWVTGGGALAIVAAVVGLLVASSRLMGRERFLSPL
jgi:hypothetical protein